MAGNLSIGDRVFYDRNGNGIFDTFGGLPEVGINGVTLSLYLDANNDGVADGAAIATTVTANGGFYRFSGLAAGTYIVAVDAANFAPAGILSGFSPSDGGSDPDDDWDNDSNGIAGPGGSVITRPVTLTVGGESVFEDNDPNTNLTVDFGFLLLNQAPTFAANAPEPVYNQGPNGPRIVADAIVADTQADFRGGLLTVTSTGAASGDFIRINTSSTPGVGLHVSGDGPTYTVTFNGVTMGTLTLTSPTSFSMTLTAGATPATVEALTESLSLLSNTFGEVQRTVGFTFTLNDGGHTGGGGQNTTSFSRTVTLIPTDSPPIANRDDVATLGLAPVTIDVLANDTDPDGGAPMAITRIGSVSNVQVGVPVALTRSLSFSNLTVSPPFTDVGTATLNADTSITFRPNANLGYLISPEKAAATGAVNSSAVFSFLYQLNNANSANVFVTVTGEDGPDDWLFAAGGNTTITGTADADTFFLNTTGSKLASGGGGGDLFYLGRYWDQGDRIDGGAGDDKVLMRGQVTAFFTAASITNVETLRLISIDDRTFDLGIGLTDLFIVMHDANVAAGQRLTVDASGLRADEEVVFNGAAETDGAFDYHGSLGRDEVIGGAGSDSLTFGPGALTLNDSIEGLSGADDRLILWGDYGARLAFALSTVRGIETIQLLSASDARHGTSGAAYRYNLAINDTTVDPGRTMTVDARALMASETLVFDGGAERDGRLIVFGGAGADRLIGGAGGDQIAAGGGDDFIDLSAGGDDVAIGGGGNDGFYFGAAYTSADIVDGEAGTLDQIGLQGDYAAGVTLGTITGVEFIVLLPGNDNRFGGATGSNLSYKITTVDANIAAGQVLTFQANTLRPGENFTLDGSAESDGSFLTFGGMGTEDLTGGDQGDGFYFGTGRFNPGDRLNGGGGSDQLGLQGDFAGANALTFGGNQLASIEFIVLLSAADTRFGGGIAGQSFSYTLTMHDDNVGSGQQIVIQANSLRAGEVLRFNGAAETDGSLRVFGGASADLIIGGQGADELWGNAGGDRIEGSGGADILRGGAGADIFVYRAISDSSAAAPDRIMDFALGDLIDLRSLDANSVAGGQQQFQLIGSGSAFNAGGQLRITQTGTSALIEGDSNGDGIADFAIAVTVIDGHALSGADFLGLANPGAEPIKAEFSALDEAGLWRERSGGFHELHALPSIDLLL